MPTVYIHPSLKRFVNEQAEINIDDIAVGQLVTKLCDQYPKLGQTILNEQGELNPYVNVYLNGENINSKRKEQQLGKADKVELLTALVGG